MAADWLPNDFEHPLRVNLATGHHLRPIRGDDVDIDFPAVMGSQQSLWLRYGGPWGWPPTTMTLAEDRVDLERHQREIQAHISFNYAILHEAEARLLGCIYLDPPEQQQDADVVVSWWLVDAMAGSELHHELVSFIPGWVTTAWPFTRPLFWP